jgi:hypothetical protein
VLAEDRDRFAREPAYNYLLKREFEEHGCKIRALDDRGDESASSDLQEASPEGGDESRRGFGDDERLERGYRFFSF